MKLLLDSHIFIWWAEDSPKLSATIRAAISDPASELFFSMASMWKIIIKEQLGKLSFPGPLEQTIPHTIAHYGLKLVSIEQNHLFRYHQLPLHHRDPFDRVLVAQCGTDGLTLATSDVLLKQYDIPILL